MSASPISPLTERYRLVSPLGVGGMGRVWLGYDEVLRRDVAVKEVVPPPGLTAAEQDMSSTRSLREARAIARLNHPNVVRIYDVVHKDPHPWIVMEYVPSRSLHQTIVEDGPLPPQEVARIGLAVLGALVAAHRAGLVHRDVKPSNVLLSGQRVVLTDWGLATMEGDASVTRSGMIIGSPAYIAPERARDGSSAPASDLWSLGATLYAAVEGHAPYERSSAIATLTALATEEPDLPRNAGPLRPVLNGLLRKDPSVRMDAEQAERLLRRALGRPKPPPTKPWRMTRQWPPHETETAVPVQEAETAVPVFPAPGDDPVVPAPATLDAPGVPAVPGVPQPPAAPETRNVLEAVRTPEATLAAAVKDVPVGAPPAGNRRIGWRTLAGILLAMLLIASLGILLASRNTPPGRSPGSGPGVAGTTHPAPPGASQPHPSATRPSSATQPSESAAPPAAQGLPAGWHLYHDSTGFTVAVPDGWSKSVRNGIVYFDEPNGHRLLGIDQTGEPKMDPVADWRAQEARRVRAGDFPGYEPLGIRHVDYHVTTADWEFRYTDRGVRTHVINRGAVFSDHQAYGIYWSTPDDQWEANLGNFRLITDSLQGKP